MVLLWKVAPDLGIAMVLLWKVVPDLGIAMVGPIATGGVFLVQPPRTDTEGRMISEEVHNQS